MGETLNSTTPMHDSINNNFTIGIVGPCSAGKTTLIQGLKLHGFTARHIAQEHSFVPNMWLRITRPDVLIFLDVSYKVSQRRRKLDWLEKDFKEQQLRLAHAREHADLVIKTDHLAMEEVLITVVDYLKDTGIRGIGTTEGEKSVK